MEPGQTATAQITGEAPNQTLSLGIPQGQTGKTGATPALEIGQVETLEPGEPATAELSGTPEAPVLSLGIPQGQPGQDGVQLNGKLGICLDTCHVHDAGYSLAVLDGTLNEFDKQIGLRHLKAVHLNDSLNPRGTHKDRHACIGQGEIGTNTLARLINHPALQGLPFCLETPNDLPGYAREIALLRGLYRAPAHP